MPLLVSQLRVNMRMLAWLQLACQRASAGASKFLADAD